MPSPYRPLPTAATAGNRSVQETANPANSSATRSPRGRPSPLVPPPARSTAAEIRRIETAAKPDHAPKIPGYSDFVRWPFAKVVKFGRRLLSTPAFTVSDRAAFAAGNYGEAREWMTDGVLVETWRELGLGERAARRMRGIVLAIKGYPDMPHGAAEAHFDYGNPGSMVNEAIRRHIKRAHGFDSDSDDARSAKRIDNGKPKDKLRITWRW